MKRIVTILSVFVIALALVAGNANAQTAECSPDSTAASAVNLSVKPDGAGGAVVSGQTPDHSNIVVNLGSAPAPSVPAVSETPAATIANTAPTPAAEECSAGAWCPLYKAASWVAGIGAVLLEVGLIALGLLAVLGGLWYILRRLRERRHDQAWHRRSARLRGWYEDALEASQQEGLDPAARSTWRRRARRRYARMLGHYEAAGVRPAVNTIPVPAPLTWDGADPADPADADEPPADA